jgi:signal transduction histidine kinase
MSGLAERLRQVDDRVWDRALVAVLCVLVVLSVFGIEDLEGPPALNLLVALGMTLPLLARRSHPIAGAAVAAAGALILVIFLTSPPELGPPVFVLIAYAYSSGAHADGAAAKAGFALIAGAILVVCLIDTPEDILFPFFVFGVAPWAIGRVIRTQTALARELAEQEARVRALREQEEASAVASERARIARDIHDVLAHSLSVMVVQASGARRALAKDPEAAIDAATLIERSGRDALVELRRLFGTVRRGEVEGLDGSPGLDQVEALVARARLAGLPATLRIEGEPVELGAGADMAAYRLVQEALTNALKHAGSSTTEVVVRYRPDGVSIEVVDEGDGHAPANGHAVGGGHGLVGMRERMSLYGGKVEAGPREGGGFAVRAHLPLQREAVLK